MTAAELAVHAGALMMLFAFGVLAFTVLADFLSTVSIYRRRRRFRAGESRGMSWKYARKVKP